MDSSEKNRNFFIAWVLFALFVLVVTASTTDLQLLLPDSGVSLPALGVQLPLFSFFLATPLLVLAVHFNLLQNLETHAFKLHRWRLAWGSNPPREELPAFIFDLAALERGSAFESLVRFGSGFLCYWLGPYVLAVILIRFSDYQNPWFTSWHFVVLATDVAITVHAIRHLPRFHSLTARQNLFFQTSRALLILTILGPVVLTVLLVWGLTANWQAAHAFMQDYRYGSANLRFAIELLLPRITVPSSTQLTPLPANLELRAKMSGKEPADWWLAAGQGVSLSNRNLLYASLTGINLDKADLTGARLDFGALDRAQLEGANLRHASLLNVDFDNANLRSANFQFANLSRASLVEADLMKARFDSANLTLAQLKSATATGAYFREATLTEANLVEASLQGADFSEANLTGANFYRARLEGANLQAAVLSKANLSSAKEASTMVRFAEAYWFRRVAGFSRYSKV